MNPEELYPSDMHQSVELEEGLERISLLIEERLREDDPFVVRIAGRTASGKSTTAERILAQFSQEALVFGNDHYFRGTMYVQNNPDDIEGLNFDHPHYQNLPRVVGDVRQLFRGEMIDMPQFDFTTGEPTGKTVQRSMGDKRFLIIDGIHAFSDAFDEFESINVFVDVSVQGSLLRRLLRDGLDFRRYSLEEIVRHFVIAEQMYRQYIHPMRHKAHVVVSNEFDPEVELMRFT